MSTKIINLLALVLRLVDHLNNRVFLSRNYRSDSCTLEIRLDFRRSLVSGLPSSRTGEERGLLSRTAAGNRAHLEIRCSENKYASFKNIKFLMGNYQTDSSET